MSIKNFLKTTIKLEDIEYNIEEMSESLSTQAQREIAQKGDEEFDIHSQIDFVIWED